MKNCTMMNQPMKYRLMRYQPTEFCSNDRPNGVIESIPFNRLPETMQNQNHQRSKTCRLSSSSTAGREYRTHVLSLLLLLLFPLLLPAQEREGTNDDESIRPKGELESVTLRAGIYGAYARHFHETTSSVFSSGLDCGAFGNGAGNGFTIGALAEIPVLDDLLDLYISLGYAQRGGAFGETVVGGLPILDPNTDTYTTLERLHSYSTDLGYFRSEFGLRATLPWLPLYVRATAAIDFGMTTTYLQTEEILSPVGVLYPETNTTLREVGSGPISDGQSLLMASGGIGYEIPLSTQLSIAPEISYYHPFNDVTLNRPWRIKSIQGGAALRWTFGPLSPGPQPPSPPIAEPSDPPAPEIPVPPTAVVVVASPAKLSMVRTIVTETFPILPYIFFDSANAALPSRYRKLTRPMTSGFDENDLSWNSLEAYHDLLNIIGRRMSDDPSISISVNGTTDGVEAGSGAEQTELAKRRGESIREYLASVWEIDPSRIEVTTSQRPRFPSSNEYVEGYAENRRVEIRSNSPEALSPVIHKRFNEYSYNPDQIALRLQGDSPKGIRSWNLKLKAGGEDVVLQGGEGPPPTSVTIGLNQERADRIAKGISGEGMLDVAYMVRGGDGLQSDRQTTIPTDVALNPFEISRLSLIVFDFDKAEITPQNQRMVKAFVADALDPSSTLTIVGSTDRLGELEHNQQLSQSRAAAVRQIIAADQPEATVTEVAGVGPRLRYDNNLPEGRYYCRTVTVEVKTPLETGG